MQILGEIKFRNLAYRRKTDFYTFLPAYESLPVLSIKNAETWTSSLFVSVFNKKFICQEKTPRSILGANVTGSFSYQSRGSRGLLDPF